MKTTNRLIRAGFLCLLLVGFSLTQANALSFYGPNYLGYIDDGIPSDPTDEIMYINTLTTLTANAITQTIGTESYNRLGSFVSGPFPVATLTDADKDETAPYSLDSNFQYILGKYDGPNDGSYVWFSNTGFSTPITLPNTSLGGYGLSHISGYNAVPLPAAVYLLGAGLVGLTGLRRKFKN